MVQQDGYRISFGEDYNRGFKSVRYYGYVECKYFIYMILYKQIDFRFCDQQYLIKDN